MRFTETSLSGVYILEPELLIDERGFFARNFCRAEFESRGLDASVEQCSTSFNRKRGTLRGMHFQLAPHEESKLVRCTMGAIYDVVIDLRTGSSTLNQWLAVELSAENRKMLYIPKGFAHGFQTLVQNSEVFYQISHPYSPEAARGLRWNDPALDIEWPIANPVISERDSNFPLLPATEIL